MHCRRLIALSFILVFGSSARSVLARPQCQQWTPGFTIAGANGDVRALATFDDGSGSALYLGGDFTVVGGIPIAHVARWDGSSWTSAGDGLPGPVYSLAVFDDGSGAALYAGMSSAQFQPQFGLWKLAGQTWTQVAGSAVPRALLSFDDGSGPALYAAGFWDIEFGGATSSSVLRWNGSAWEHMDHGVGGGWIEFAAYSLATFDDGNGPALYIGGLFETPQRNIGKWNGAHWVSVGGGVGLNFPSTPQGYVLALATFDSGSGPELYAGGTFTMAGSTPVHAIARWDGANWSDVGGGVTGQQAVVRALTVFDDGSGPALYVGGKFTSAGGAPALNFARWDGVSWSTSATSPDDAVFALATFDDGGGAALHAGGVFGGAGAAAAKHVARLDGGAWSSLGSAGDGMESHVNDLFIVDAGGEQPALIAAGSFRSAGSSAAKGVARWNGSDWSPLGAGLSPLFTGSVDAKALAQCDFGSGSALYVAGEFRAAPNCTPGLVRWDGASWSVVPVGSNACSSPLETLCGFDDGGGPKLYVGGRWLLDVTTSVAAFDGASWTALGGVANGSVRALAVFDDGTGPALHAAGAFSKIGAVDAWHVAKWNGASWEPLGRGIGGTVYALAVFDDGTGPALHAGGRFAYAGSTMARNFARWDGSDWREVGGGTSACGVQPCGEIRTLEVVDDGSGSRPALYVGGSFHTAGGLVVDGLARWDGSTWSAVDGGVAESIPFLPETSDRRGVLAIASFDDGASTGPSLYVGGNFQRAGGIVSQNIARIENTCLPGTAFCFGDGSSGVACPCALPDTVPSPSGAADSGCANAFDLRGGRLYGSGLVNPDRVVLRADRLPPSAFAFFASGTAMTASAQPFGDGLLCIGGSLVRFGSQNASAGSVRYPNGLLGYTFALHVASGFAVGSGQTGHYQLVYRDVAAAFCNAATINATNAYRVIWK